jgi:hypothetical protein
VADSAGGGVEKEEEVTLDRFVAVEGWGSTGGWPATGAQGALQRRAGSGGLRSGSGGAVVLGEWGGSVGLARRHWTVARCARGEGSGAGAQAGRRRAAQERPVGARPLKAGAAAGDGFESAAVWAGSLGMRARTLADAPGRRTGDGSLVSRVHARRLGARGVPGV